MRLLLQRMPSPKHEISTSPLFQSSTAEVPHSCICNRPFIIHVIVTWGGGGGGGGVHQLENEVQWTLAYPATTGVTGPDHCQISEMVGYTIRLVVIAVELHTL